MAKKSTKRGLANIKIVGVGGGGSNAVSRMNKGKIKGVDLVCINTDDQALDRMDVPTRLRIGEQLTKGLGAGGDPNLGWKSAEESQAAIREVVKGADMVFIAAGMGGGTGTGAAPVVARLARASGALTVAVVTKPFSFEGGGRRQIAEEGIKLLGEHADTLVTVSNDRLLELCDVDLSIMGAFNMVDDVLCQGIQSISEVVNVTGEINVDFADVRTIMADSGIAMMSIGSGEGGNRAQQAIDSALSSPLLETSIEGANGILFNISGGDDLTLAETNRIAGLVGKAANPDAQIIFGVLTDPKMKDKIRVTLIATGLGTGNNDRASSKLYQGLQVESAPQSRVKSGVSSKEGAGFGISTFFRRRNSRVREETLR